MPNPTDTAQPTVSQAENSELAREAKDQVNAILARTNWQEYWSNVSEQAEPEIEAYEAACARSLASASRKYVQ